MRSEYGGLLSPFQVRPGVILAIDLTKKSPRDMRGPIEFAGVRSCDDQNVCRMPIRTSVCVLPADEMPLPTSPTDAVAATRLPYGSSVLPLAFW